MFEVRFHDRFWNSEIEKRGAQQFARIRHTTSVRSRPSGEARREISPESGGPPDGEKLRFWVRTHDLGQPRLWGAFKCFQAGRESLPEHSPVAQTHRKLRLRPKQVSGNDDKIVEPFVVLIALLLTSPWPIAWFHFLWAWLTYGLTRSVEFSKARTYLTRRLSSMHVVLSPVGKLWNRSCVWLKAFKVWDLGLKADPPLLI